MNFSPNDAVYDKLKRIVGPQQAEQLIQDTLDRLGIKLLSTAEDRLRFGSELAKQGGVLSAIGRSIKIQAILQGAADDGP